MYPFNLVKKTLFSCFILSLIASYGFAQSITRLNGSTIEPEQLSNRIEKLMHTAQVTGLAVSVFNDNEVVYQQTFGYRNAELKDSLAIHDIFYGASLSKAVFAHLVMQLVEAGKLDLDASLQHYLDKPLPDYRGFETRQRGFHHLKGDKRYEKITARMCLTHTTGFPNWRFLTANGYDRNGKLYFQFDPGSRYSYSGEGIYLLQFVLEQITGQGLEQLAQHLIFEHLGMDNSSYIYVWPEGQEEKYVYGHDQNEQVLPKDEVDEAGGAGTLATTLADYSKFMTAVMKRQLIQEKSFGQMFSPQVRIKNKRQFGPDALLDTDENDDIKLSYGLGWGILSSPYGIGAFKEGGSDGYKHYSIFFPEQNIGVLIMTNSDNGESIFKELLEITIGDVYTPWQWNNYIPYDQEI
jgi:serine-type D-Ala-D-Ala carboxypeptidase/endopeptidase